MTTEQANLIKKWKKLIAKHKPEMVILRPKNKKSHYVVHNVLKKTK